MTGGLLLGVSVGMLGISFALYLIVRGIEKDEPGEGGRKNREP